MSTTKAAKKYKGIRRRKWGKWVSEIRVPGTQERLWLGSYLTPEAAAVAHDVAFYYLRRPSSSNGLNFPAMLPPSIQSEMSPKSVQRAASDAGMAVDARAVVNSCSKSDAKVSENYFDDLELEIWEDHLGDDCEKWEGSEVKAEGLSISVEDYL